YSLGVILYEALAGQPPFSGNSIEVENKHRQEVPAPLLTMRANAPPALAQLVKNTLNKDPQARPQSARDFAHILKNIARSLDGAHTNGSPIIGEQKEIPLQSTPSFDATPQLN